MLRHSDRIVAMGESFVVLREKAHLTTPGSAPRASAVRESSVAGENDRVRMAHGVGAHCCHCTCAAQDGEFGGCYRE
jgi:hypothetical protein